MEGVTNTPTSSRKESFYTYISRKFGQETVKNLKDLSNNNLNMVKISNRKVFLLKCRTYNVIPKFISNNIINKSNFFTVSVFASNKVLNLQNRYSKKLLNIAIKDTHNIQKSITNKIAQLREEIQFTLPSHKKTI